MTASERFRKNERLRKRCQFQAVMAGGRKLRIDKTCTLLFLPNGLDLDRLGIITSRKIGNAVIRNRAKRRMREIFRHRQGDFSPKMDFVLIAAREFAFLSFPILNAKVQRNIRKAYQSEAL